MESHVAHAFLLAQQDAKSIEEAASRTVARRIIVMIRCKVGYSAAEAADNLLAGVHRSRRRRRRGLLAGRKNSSGSDEGEDSDFHVCVWILTS